MKLTLDASMVIKWFVAEPMSDEARLPLARRIHLQAPELLLVEFANTIWKKATEGTSRRTAVPAKNSPVCPTSSPCTTTGISLNEAERIALATWTTRSTIVSTLHVLKPRTRHLITADKRFADKAVDKLPGARVRYIGAPDVADWIETSATAPVIEREKADVVQVCR